MKSAATSLTTTRGNKMRHLVALLALGCSAAIPRTEPLTAVSNIPPGTYELRANDTAGARMPVLKFELGPDGVLRVTEGDVLHVRTQLTQHPGGELEFMDQDGPRACRNPDPIPGRYRAERAADGWRLRVVTDSCDGRKGALDGSSLVRAGQ